MKKESRTTISNPGTTPFALDVALGEDVQQAHRTQQDYEKWLAADKTKTDGQKAMMAAEHGVKAIGIITKKVYQKQRNINDALERFVRRCKPDLTIKGTTDLLIMGSYVQAGLKPSQVMAMAERGDIDPARAALLHPLAKIDPAMQAAAGSIRTAVEKQLLGEADFELREDLRKRFVTLAKLDPGDAVGFLS